MTSARPSFTWKNVFLSEPGEISWQHSGIDVLSDGRLIYAAPDGSTLVIDDVANGVREFVSTPANEMHDVVATADGIWICDIGHKYVLAEGSYIDKFMEARILRIDINGDVLQELIQPELNEYKEKKWSPTGITLAPNGDIWVADGYSSYLILRFNSAGQFIESFNGEKAGLAFNCPHTIRCIITDGYGYELVVPEDPGYEQAEDPGYELVVADRANKRLVWMTPDGEVTRIESNAALTSPSGITRYGDGLLVTQLHGSLVYVGNDGDCEVILAGPDIHLEAGWPNSLDQADVPVAPSLSTQSLIAPHGITSTQTGEVFLTQWLIGGHVLGGSPK